MRVGTLQSDDRAVSIAVTHVLTIGITTILITGLLVGGSGLLEDEKSDATRSELRTIGNRMASEMSSTYYSANESGTDGEMVVRVTHPQSVAGNTYNVELNEDCDGIPGFPSDHKCLIMKPPQGQDEVKIPLDPDIELDSSSTTVQGGSFYIVVEKSGGSYVLTVQSSPPPKLASPVPDVSAEVER